MANICTNILEVHCQDTFKLKQIVKWVQNRFECYSTIEVEDVSTEFEFASSNEFPKAEMEELTTKYKDDTLYIQVITYELANEVLEHHVYKKGIWTDLIAVKSANNQNQKYHE
ncbi:hypothetical protein [Dysgonomonas sp. ZJ279]|uniref:hypothetical protein n=1 Tax=Dysgonomonas sp. ZJ279 TaxID=2709796 RepID=UPI0013EAF4B4|nr:hypothetical protein [Dysgonomonas sp. ZJ279]